jgi:hypothetical protein
LVRQAALAKVNEWKSQQQIIGSGVPADKWRLYHATGEGLDELKRAIDGIDASSGPAVKVKADIYDAVKNEIVSKAPKYADIMNDYELASRKAAQLQKQFSLAANASDTTAAGKLQRSAREDATTNYKALEEGFQKLAAYEPNLIAARAGQQLASATPRGVTSNMFLKGVGGEALAHHLLTGRLPLSVSELLTTAGVGAASWAATSPRMWAAAAQTAGQARAPVRAAGRALGSVGINPSTIGAGAAAARDVPDSVGSYQPGLLDRFWQGSGLAPPGGQ